MAELIGRLENKVSPLHPRVYPIPPGAPRSAESGGEFRREVREPWEGVCPSYRPEERYQRRRGEAGVAGGQPGRATLGADSGRVTGGKGTQPQGRFALRQGWPGQAAPGLSVVVRDGDAQGEGRNNLSGQQLNIFNLLWHVRRQ